jgi:hypothetical protein
MTLLSGRLLLFLTLLSGCDVIWRIDPVESTTDAPSPPGNPVAVSGVLRREVMRDDADLQPVLMTVVPLDAVLGVSFKDGTDAVVILAADGTFSFTSPHENEPYALTVTTMYSTRTYELTAVQPQLVERLYGRDMRTRSSSKRTLASRTHAAATLRRSDRRLPSAARPSPFADYLRRITTR